MPVYDYKCEHCGCFDLKQRITEDALEVCPTCGGPVQRLISKNVGVIFKGSGFYTTDNTVKSRARSLNHERQKDDQALLDGDVGAYVAQTDSTNNKIAEAKASS